MDAFKGNGRVTGYEKLHFSFGGLPQGDCSRVVGGNSGISLDIYWENATLLNEGRCADRFMAVVLFENDEFIAYTDLGSIYPRSGCHALIRLPEGKFTPYYISETGCRKSTLFLSPASPGLLFLCSCKR